MKNSIKFTLILIVYFFQFNLLFSQSNSIENKAYTLVKIIEKHHYSPRNVDDKFSELVIDEILKQLDPFKMVLTKSDADSIKSYTDRLGTLILNKKPEFTDALYNIYKQRFHITDSVFETLKSTTFNFNVKDTINMKVDNEFRTPEEISQYIPKLIKSATLGTYFSLQFLYDSTLTKEENLIKLKDKTIDRFRLDFEFNEEKSSLKAFTETTYLKAIAHAFDPHTVYFPPMEEEEFNNSLSRKIFAFGIEFYKNDKDNVEITDILPGSPAWISGQINEGDIIISIKTSKNKVNLLSAMSAKEIDKLFSEIEVEEVIFHILKKNNKEIDVSLKKEAVYNDDNAIDSYILKGEKNIGYIYLPSFYVEKSDLNMNFNGSAADIAKSIIRLKDDNIDGLIINLNYNGGGSMQEAINMAGILIDFGAVAILKQKGKDPVSLRDMNRGTIYDGPLVVIINTFSASASEFFAAAIQDYNRGVIIGSQSFGKATGQEVIPFDMKSNYKKHEAYLKLTTAEIFRVDGKSNQRKGVIPDIELPDYFNHDTYCERNYKSALKNTTVDKNTYFKALDTLPVNYLRNLSKLRIKNDSAFKKIDEINAKYTQRTEYKIPLNITEYEQYIKVDANEMINDYEKENALFKIEKPSSLKDISNMQDPENNNEENIKNRIKEDIYIKEAYKILIDWINLINK